MLRKRRLSQGISKKDDTRRMSDAYPKETWPTKLSTAHASNPVMDSAR